MKITRPEIGFERLLAALGQDLLDAGDEEILAVADELGLKPGMKGSMALFGVTFAAQLKKQDSNAGRRIRENSGRMITSRSRRRLKGDAPSST